MNGNIVDWLRRPAGNASVFFGLLVFVICYGQSPLYSSNQHTYFLPGLAAIEPQLAFDPLVLATSHIPVFSHYVSFVAGFLGEWFFYLIHASFVAAYGFVLFRLSMFAVSTPRDNFHVVLFFVVLSLVHSEALQVAMNSVASGAGDGLRLLTEGFAGQPLIRSYHQPSSFSLLVPLGLLLFCLGHERISSVVIALAPVFHPAYFLPAGLLVAVLMASMAIRRAYWNSFLFGLIALGVVFPAVIYTAINFSPTTDAASAEAARILVDERFPHHANPANWFGVSVVFQLIWVMAAVAICSGDRLFRYLLVLFSAFSLLSVLIFFVLDSSRFALLVPWRAMVFVVPIATGFIVFWLTRGISGRSSQAWLRALSAFVVLAPVFLAVGSVSLFDRRIEAAGKVGPMGEYANQHCESMYLVPIHWDWFRLVSRCPVYADWKSHPYRDVDVLAWYQRVSLAAEFYRLDSLGERACILKRMRGQYPIGHVVVAAEDAAASEFNSVFSSSGYVVIPAETWVNQFGDSCAVFSGGQGVKD